MSIITLLNKIADRLDELESAELNRKLGIHPDAWTQVSIETNLSKAIREILADPNNDIHGTEL